MRALLPLPKWHSIRSLAIGVGAAIGLSACASSAASATSPDREAASVESLAAMDRLQGRWEIQSYQSIHVIPEEATPLMAQLFDQLELRFEGTRAFVRIGSATEETPMSVRIDRGQALRLDVAGGMFDGAALRFIDDDRIELYDVGKPWPGVSVLKRKR